MTSLVEIRDVLALAIRQLTDLKFLKVLILSVGIALLLTGPFLLVFVIIASVIEWILPASITLPWLGEVGFLGVFTTGLVSKTSWVFWTYIMSPVAFAVIGVFLETIVDAVEARHYPALLAVRRRSIGQVVGYALRFLMMMLGVSLLALIASLFSGAFAPLVFVVANGFLISREYFETVALRRLPAAEAAALTRQSMPLLLALGCVLAALLGIPFVNLLIPIIGVAAFTHLFHRFND